MPEETALKVEEEEALRTTVGEGGGGGRRGRLRGEDIFYLSATSTTAVVADAAPVCFS